MLRHYSLGSLSVVRCLDAMCSDFVVNQITDTAAQYSSLVVVDTQAVIAFVDVSYSRLSLYSRLNINCSKGVTNTVLDISGDGDDDDGDGFGDTSAELLNPKMLAVRSDLGEFRAALLCWFVVSSHRQLNMDSIS